MTLPSGGQREERGCPAALGPISTRSGSPRHACHGDRLHDGRRSVDLQRNGGKPCLDVHVVVVSHSHQRRRQPGRNGGIGSCRRKHAITDRVGEVSGSPAISANVGTCGSSRERLAPDVVMILNFVVVATRSCSTASLVSTAARSARRDAYEIGGSRRAAGLLAGRTTNSSFVRPRPIQMPTGDSGPVVAVFEPPLPCHGKQALPVRHPGILARDDRGRKAARDLGDRRQPWKKICAARVVKNEIEDFGDQKRLAIRI